MKKVILFLIIIVLIIGYVVYDNSTIEITSYDVFSDKIPTSFKNYKIALITDFHNSNNYDQIVNKISSIEPNIIVLGGDIINMSDDNVENCKKLVEGLKGKGTLYFVKGNHESFSRLYKDNFYLYLNKEKIKILNGSHVELAEGKDKINLYGLVDPFIQDNEFYNNNNDQNILKSIGKIDEKNYNILVMHRANLFPIMAEAKFDLILSGHMHGGLIRIPFVGGIVSPNQEWFPHYTKGLYTQNSSKMIVSRGVDSGLRRIRVFNGPEIVEITLKGN